MDYLMKGERVYLRDMTPEDTDDIVRWRNASHVVKNFIYRIPLTREDHLNWIKNKVETGLVRQFVVGRISDGREFGSIYFRDIDNEKHTAEFGIFLGEPDMAGQGYGFEAQKLSMEFAFARMGMEKVELRVLEANKAAIHIYEKCGFKLIEGEEDFTSDGEKVLFMLCTKDSFSEGK